MTHPSERPDAWLPPSSGSTPFGSPSSGPAGEQPRTEPSDAATPPPQHPFGPGASRRDGHPQAPSSLPGYRATPPQPPAPVACYRHPNATAGVRCQRCGRPICGNCMVEAPVGHQCPECVHRGRAASGQGRLPYGGRRSANPKATTLALIAINALVFAVTSLAGRASSRVFDYLALTPRSICAVGSSYYQGVDATSCAASGGTWLPGFADGAWWQLLTSAFVHANLLHIAVNMLALWFIGPQLEEVLGRTRFLVLYLLSALAGGVAVAWLSAPHTPTVGASGAIFGLLGALLVLVVRSGGNPTNLLMWLGINVAITFMGTGISWQGHLGGFLGGAAVAAILVGLRGRQQEPAQRLALAALTLALLGVAFARPLLA